MVEVIIATAMVGILAAVAVPSYSNYTRRANVAGGVTLAAPAQLKIAEEAVVGKNQPNGPGMMAWAPPIGPDGNPIVIVPFEVIPNSSSAMVKNIVRVETNNVVINYSPNFNPVKQYSLLLVGQRQGMGMKWTCKSGADAQPLLDYYKSGGADTGTAIPPDWAPANCR